MLGKPGFAQHLAGVAANGYGNSGLKIMMVVKGEPMWKFGNATFVIGDVTKVFTDIFEITFEAAHGHGIKIDHACLALDVFVVESEWVFGNNPVIEISYFSHHTSEVFDVQSTA